MAPAAVRGLSTVPPAQTRTGTLDADTIYGGGGDAIHGSGGNDHIYGDADDDHLYGDAGADTYNGDSVTSIM